MNSKARQAISDLLDLSASASGCRWMAVLADHSPGLVVHPPEDQEEICLHLEARKEFLSRAADGPIDPGTLIPVPESEATCSGTGRIRPGFFTAIGLFDRAGKRQGTLVALDSDPKELDEKQKSAITRIAGLAETQIEAGAIEDFNRGLETQNTQYSLLSEVARQITNGVVVTDESGLVTWANHGFEVISGYSLDEILGKKPGALLQGEKTDPATVAYMRQQLVRREAFTAELINYQRDGTPYWIRIQCQPLELGNGARQGFIAIQTDISASEEAKADLQRFRKTLDSTLDCVFMFDADTLEFFYVNQGAVDHLGYSQQELLKMHPFDIKPQYPETSFREMVLPLVNGQIPRVNFQTLHRHKDGHDIPVDVSLQYIKPEGDSPRFIAIVRDTSEQQRHQSEIGNYRVGGCRKHSPQRPADGTHQIHRRSVFPG
jgi:PAS domain S-box-containing protein